ncbi:MAG: HEPN domain-containing protein [Thermoguttaceae bacterium]|jgi:HEPN domain-containing protein
MDLRQQIDFWLESSKEDLDAAEALFNNRKFRHALFFAHLAVEKILKAHVTKASENLPPRTHDLLRLVNLTGLTISELQHIVLAQLQQYCLEGRYPDFQPVALNKQETQKELEEARSIHSWLANQLK